MNPLANPGYLLPPLLAMSVSLILAAMMARQVLHNRVHRSFAVFLLVVAGWSFLTFFMRSSPDVSHALAWERALVPVAMATSAAFFLFTRAYIRTTGGGVARWGVVAFLAALAGLAGADLLVERMELHGYGYAPIFKPWFFPVALAAYGFTVAGILLLARAYRRARTYEERNRHLYLVVGACFPLVGTMVDLLPSMYPASILGNLVFGVMTLVAIRRYHLLDLSLALRKGLAYLLLSLLVALPYVLAIKLAVLVFQDTGAEPIVYVFLVLVLALGLQPLWSGGQQVVDRLFFRRRLDALRALDDFTRRSHGIAEQAQPGSELVEVVRNAVQADGVALLLPGKDGEFAASASVGREALSGLRIPRSSLLLRWLARERQPLEHARLDHDAWLQNLARPERDALEAAGVELMVPLHMRDRLSGVLVLGPKRSESPYSRDELTLLSMVATQMAVALDDARLYEQVSSQLDAERRRLAAFRTAATRLVLESDATRALQDLADTARDLVSARRCVLTLAPADGPPERVFLSATGAAGALSHKNGGPPDTEGRGGHGDLTTEAGGVALDGAGQLRTLSIPVARGGREVGTLLAEDKEGQAGFSDDDRRILELCAVFAQVLLENLSLYSAVTQERGTLAAIQASMTEGLLVLDGEERVHYCNEAAAKMLRAPASDAVEVSGGSGLRALLARFEPAEGLEELLAGATGDLTAPFQVELQAFQDDPLDLLVTAFPIPVASGERMTGLFFRDITSERDVKRRQDQFVSIASHELRTPLTTILGFTDLLLDWDGLGPKHRCWVEYIRNDSRRLAAIVEELLDVSRIESGRLSTTAVPVSLRELVDSVIGGARVKTERHRFTVRVERDADRVVADRDKVVQVLTNLVTNAVNYSPDGGTIAVAVAEDRSDGSVVVSVADQGVGIAPRDMSRLFAPFDRIQRSETEEVRGTGLGLYIVKGLVEFMGGRVWVKSKLGKGSTFYFSLPRRPSETGEVGAATWSTRSGSNGK